ncbi:MAG: DUF305 domain-containing protein [Alphaproteobacteria bacterium]
MPQSLVKVCFLALALGAGAPPAIAQTGHGSHGAGHGAAPLSAMPPSAVPMSAASQAYMEAMKVMDRDMAAMPMTGKAGVDFAAMMIPHHQAAIDMANAYLASGDKDPELTQLSREIVAAQEREIAFLRGWLAKQPR